MNTDEKDINRFCRDINAILAERYGLTVKYRVEYRVTKRYAGEASRFDILFTNIVENYPTREHVTCRNGNYDECRAVLAAIWDTINILPGHK